jgi:hypothetical protein
VVESQVTPERPRQLANVGKGFTSWNTFLKKDLGTHIWGASEVEDIKALCALLVTYRPVGSGGDAPSPGHLYLLALFAETLIQLPQYAGNEYNLVLNTGNIFQRYFQLTGAGHAARAMLNYFERASNFDDEPLPTCLAKHSFGMATIYLMDRFEELEAERVTHRTGLRMHAIDGLREAIRLVDKITKVEKIDRQRARIQFALADLLVRGRASRAEQAESLSIFQELPFSEWNELALLVRAVRAESYLLSDLPTELTEESLRPQAKALEELAKITWDVTLLKFQHRWHWALSMGQFLMRLGEWQDAKPFLESAVTFILKDTAFQIDPQVVTNDAERYHRAFSILACLYVSIGWWGEALALLETYRGRVITLAALRVEKLQSRRLEETRSRDKKYFGMFSAGETPTLTGTEEAVWEQQNGTKFGPFREDYELPGFSDRLLDLFRQIGDETTMLISLSIDDIGGNGKKLMSAVVLGPPTKPARPGKCRAWSIDEEEWLAVTSDLYRESGSFRERRLQKLGEKVFAQILKPIEEDLKFFGCTRALLVAPGRLSNVPFEAYRMPDNYPHSELMPRHFAFMPSFLFGAGYKSEKRRLGTERILIIGYQGVDLPNAHEEAELLMHCFGDRADYIPGKDCTKKSVCEMLNGGYDFIHFICHGTYDPAGPRESSLYFRDEWKMDAYRLRASELRQFVRFRKRPVVTLSACSTALTADSRSNTWHGLPGSLLEVGARCIIGTRWPVADRAARVVMSEFYGLLLATDKTPLQCFHAVQDNARKEGRVEEWACFGYLGLP